MRKPKITKRILEAHESHYLNTDFDYWCVAPHGSEYEPKYIKDMGEYPCHGYELYCSEYCGYCMGEKWRCPVEGCNKAEYYDEDGEWAGTNKYSWEE